MPAQPVKLSEQSLEQFVAYARLLRGDEKGEAQNFLEHLFQAFGHRSLAEAGAVLEERVKQARRGGKATTTFADLVWRPRVLIEMKARGERLERHYRQAFDYWCYLVPNRPRWVVLCNFDEFWIYDFDQQVDEPLEKVRLVELPQRSAALAFLRPEEQEPIFGVNRIGVTQEAAERVATVFKSLVARKIDREQAQRFVLQCVVAKFSEDLGLLPKEFFTRLLQECLASNAPGEHAYDMIGGLFRQMSSRSPALGGRFRGVGYFNGGLYSNIEPIVLETSELKSLFDAALQDWSQVNPAIFGTIFQQSLSDQERHNRGAHFTSEADILRVVMPTLVNPWQEQIAGAKRLEELLKLRQRLLSFKVLDPTCGSGNFLYVAFRELKRIETDLLLAIRRFTGSRAKAVTRGFLSVHQFFGFDIIPIAVELAKVTLLLAKELALKEAQTAQEQWQGSLEFDTPLPLDNLDNNIRCADALLMPWPEVDAIIGNPPFQSKNKAQEEFGPAYLSRIREAFPGVSGKADYCVYFFRKAHDSLPQGARAGLVGTNTIRQNESREGGLDYIVKHGGAIVEAISTQRWSGDATVHVSIVNWVRGTARGKKKLSWQLEDGSWVAEEVDQINSSLSNRVDVSTAVPLRACAKPEFCAQGQTHGHEGFLIPSEEAESLLKRRPAYSGALFPFLIGEELLARRDGRPTRYVIDFHPRDQFEAQKFSELFERVRRDVLPDRQAAAKKEKTRNEQALASNPDARVNRHHSNFLARWWLLSYPRTELMELLAELPRYIVCVRVTKRPVFEFISSSIHPNDSLQVFPLPDDYSFGILQSSIHWEWFTARCSTLKDDFRYTSNTVFDTFPWPQEPTLNQVKAVASAAVDLRKLRRELISKHGWSLRELYRAAEQPGRNPLKDAQAELDRAVAAAYGMRARASPLAYLLQLNQTLARAEARGEDITGPGLPECVKNSGPFITRDCISMPGKKG